MDSRRRPPPPSSLVCPLLFPSKSRAKGPSAVPRCLDSLSRSQRRLSPTVLKKKLKQAPASVVISTPKDALNDIAGLGPCAAAAAASKQQRRSSASFGGLVRALSRSPIGGSAGGAGALADSCEMSPKSAQTDEERGEKRRVDREKNGLGGGRGSDVDFRFDGRRASSSRLAPATAPRPLKKKNRNSDQTKKQSPPSRPRPSPQSGTTPPPTTGATEGPAARSGGSPPGSLTTPPSPLPSPQPQPPRPPRPRRRRRPRWGRTPPRPPSAPAGASVPGTAGPRRPPRQRRERQRRRGAPPAPPPPLFPQRAAAGPCPLPRRSGGARSRARCTRTR